MKKENSSCHALNKKQLRRRGPAGGMLRMTVETLEKRLAMTASGSAVDDATPEAHFDANSLLLKFTDETHQIPSSIADALLNSNALSMTAVFSDYELTFGGHIHDVLLSDSKTYLDVAQEVGLDRWYEIQLPASADLDSLAASAG